MRYSDSRDSANRHSNAASRATVESTDDSKLIQELGLRLFHDEQQSTIESLTPYGFTSRVQPPTTSGTLRRTAEAIIGFLTGNRSHGIALVVGDRRFRLMNLQTGETAIFDDQGTWIYLRRSGVLAKVPNNNSVTLQVDVSGAQEGPPSGGNGQDASTIPGAVCSITLSKSAIAITTQDVPVNVTTNGGNIALNAGSGTVAINGGLVDINDAGSGGGDPNQ